jgi:hypothetical protein
MLSTPPSPPPFDQVYKGDLKAFLNRVQTTLDAACDVAVRVFESHRWKTVDSGLHAYLARFYASQRLDDEIDQMALPFVRVKETNSGLFFVSDAYALRVLKAGHDFDDDGNVIRRLPTPGNSRARSRYYHQEWQQPLFRDAIEAQQYALEGIGPQIRLLALWDAGPGYQLGALDLVCPRSGARTKDTVKFWWYESILEPPAAPTVSSAPSRPGRPSLPEPNFKLPQPETKQQQG